jgi:hypothetical protein
MCVVLIWIQFELTMSSSSGVGNGARGRGIVRRRGGCGLGRGGLGGHGGVWEDPLPQCPILYFHREITLQMGASQALVVEPIPEVEWDLAFEEE